MSPSMVSARKSAHLENIGVVGQGLVAAKVHRISDVERPLLAAGDHILALDWDGPGRSQVQVHL